MRVLINPRDILRQAQGSGRAGPTLQRRLFAFFAVFLVGMMSVLFLILFSSGVFSTGVRESRVFLENELGHAVTSVEKEYGALAVEGVALSAQISDLIEKNLPAGGITALSGQREVLNAILENAAAPLLAALEKNKASGVFMVLDATVNPDLPGAENSRAGLYFKNMEPNAIHMQTPTIRFLRGPTALARKLSCDVLPQWTMEFAVEPGDFFTTVTQAARAEARSLSRLYYWSPAGTLKGDYEQAMWLCVPLQAHDGTVLGVCGFEVSAMLFKLQNSPDNAIYTRVLTALGPVENGRMTTAQSLFAGSYAAMAPGMPASLGVYPRGADLFTYSGPTGEAYVGLHQAVRLYPRDAVFEQQQWALAILVPEGELSAHIAGQNRIILYMLGLLLFCSMGAAFVISRRYLAPVVTALDNVKSGSRPQAKTNIQEIDDLFAFLAEQDSVPAAYPHWERKETENLYEKFVQNIETLSPAERAVFNLYMEGYDAKKITEILFLSINTIKTHNRRIYQKLSVSSRKELMVYVGMMKEKMAK